MSHRVLVSSGHHADIRIHNTSHTVRILPLHCTFQCHRHHQHPRIWTEISSPVSNTTAGYEQGDAVRAICFRCSPRAVQMLSMHELAMED